ncbi:MAG: thiamine phosphate synthase [Vallitalea sp.]|jgi:thiamine-phosphate diphosphorylase|nr:thiamine phosphate synthase [Vallitalea sp.]
MKFDKDIYLITKDYIDFNVLLTKTEEALSEGVRILQYRSKDNDKLTQCNQSHILKGLCHKYNTKLIINDDVDIAIEVGADGVHLGQDDINIDKARNTMGNDFIIGATTKTVDQAIKAYEQGADYLGVGALYPSPTKINAKTIDIQTLINIKNAVPISIVGIGGITADNLTTEIVTNVDAIAVISEIYDSNNIKEKVNQLNNMLK